jgi:mRNA-degrading endonuclease RelE of RelBE toxin-antitoxin system
MPDKIAKFITSLDQKTKGRLKERLLKLKQNPFQNRQDIKKLSVRESNVYRLRMGKIRIIFKVIENEVDIIDIDYRGNIY